MATLFLMVGLPCSGKTTKAKELENKLSALRLTPDDWHVGLFGHDIYHPEHDQRHTFIESMLWRVAKRALELGTNVILDFGFWSKEERDYFRAEAHMLGAASEIIFMDVAEEELIRRMRLRNENLSDSIHFIPEDLMRSWVQLFQPPDTDELLPQT